MPIQYWALGRYIRECRAARGLNQTAAAKKIGMRQQQLSDWENGLRLIRKDKFKVLSTILGCDIETMERLLNQKTTVSFDDNLLPIIQAVATTAVQKVSIEDLLFLAEIQKVLPSAMSKPLINQLLSERHQT